MPTPSATSQASRRYLAGASRPSTPGVHSGILARRDDPAQMAQLDEHGLQQIHLVAVNLYPFAQTISREGVTQEEAVEQIDIGGPTMIRAAAKNFASVLVLSDPADYERVLDEWQQQGEVSAETRRSLAAKAFRHVSEYDTLIADYLSADGGTATSDLDAASMMPESITLRLQMAQPLRYGENPHQQAALYRDDLPISGPDPRRLA